MDYKTLWKDCLSGISAHVSPQHFATWFRPIRAIGGGELTLILQVPNRFFFEWIKEHYLALIQEVLRKNTGREFMLEWRVADEPRATAVPVKKRVKKTTTRSRTAKPSITLNSKYTFDNFVVGKDNEFAHAACTAVSSHLTSKYNPLFIYGAVGLGKTHLLQAIGHHVLENNEKANICYYTSERFMNDFINYVSRQKMADFREKFRNVDMLLIDDIQFWSGKERTQEEFFHTFNTLYESHKQIVVTCDKFPKDIDGLEERLRSRFEWGLIADIQPPDIETKIAILKKKISVEDVWIPDDVINWVASVSGSNIRELEGFLNRIVAVSSLTNQKITLAMSKDTLKNLMKDEENKVLSITEIQKAVSSFYQIKFSDLKSKRRHKTIALPRQVAMFLAREYGSFSFPEIGSAFGGKDHSTAIHAVKKITRELQNDNNLKRSVGSIKKNLGVN
ncbi:MAG: chromosomal replication initiator protein DnaA [Thermodesulfobacteriota bacterium]